jgi:hypothetical protein
MAVVGLGTGCLTCYGRAGQEIDVYEIDSSVLDIAQREFSFLRNTSAKVNVILGDARLKLAHARDGKYGMIFVDAFSSDAIPLHLLTREALREVYLPKLAPGGVLAFHISNRYLDLLPVLADLAASEGLSGYYNSNDEDKQLDRAATTWVVLARDVPALGGLATDSRWEPLHPSGRAVWTDDFSNILSVFRNTFREDIAEVWAKIFRK